MAWAAVQAADATRYPDPQYTALKSALARHHRVDPWRVVLAGSASHTGGVALAGAAQLPAKPLWAADPMNLFVVVESGDHHVSILDGDKLEPIHRFQSRFALHGGPKFTPEGRYVFFASRDGWITKYDLWNLAVVAEVRAGLSMRNVAVSADGQWIMAANYLPHTLALFDAEPAQLGTAAWFMADQAQHHPGVEIGGAGIWGAGRCCRGGCDVCEPGLAAGGCQGAEQLPGGGAAGLALEPLRLLVAELQPVEAVQGAEQQAAVVAELQLQLHALAVVGGFEQPGR